MTMPSTACEPTEPTAEGLAARGLSRLTLVLVSHRFPVFALTVIFGISLAMLAVLFIPNGPSGLGAFAEDFKIWCFGYDPATGTLQWAYVLTIALQPIVLGALISFVWSRQLRDGLAQRASMVGWALGGFGVVAAAAAVLVLSVGPAQASGELPFPAEELRTAHEPPPIALTDQDGQAVDLAALRGDVVLVTAVYASCGDTCPMIMAETKRVVEALSERERADLRILAITLDPEHDDVARLAAVAAAQGISAPLYHLLAGPVGEVNRILDQLEIPRRRDPATGIIEHANIFLLVDRAGQIAYRLSLGPRQERWLESALHLLLREG